MRWKQKQKRKNKNQKTKYDELNKEKFSRKSNKII
jgi:hypothetical protein